MVAPAVPPAAVPPAAVPPPPPAAPAGGAAPAPAAPKFKAGDQVPTVTTVLVHTVINGVPTGIMVPFTQTFKDVVSQGPLPEVGTIGLGTLTG